MNKCILRGILRKRWREKTHLKSGMGTLSGTVGLESAADNDHRSAADDNDQEIAADNQEIAAGPSWLC